MILFNEDVNQVLLKQAVAERKTGSVILEIPTIWAGGTIQCWMYFSSVDGKVKSVSQYIGDVTL